MKENILKGLPLKVQEDICKLTTIIIQMGFTPYIIGGVVRDWLLNRTVKDIDMVVLGDATLVAKEYEKKYNTYVKIFPRFYTATIPLEDNFYKNIDLISARNEIYPQPGKLPIVQKGNLRDDLNRRDFTINTLGFDLQNFELIDLYDGKKDLFNKIIRVLHPKSFEDDPTRILRAIRFKNRYDFNYERHTEDYMMKAINGNAFKSVSKDRIKKEMLICLQEKKSYKIILEFIKLNILKELFFIEQLSKEKIMWLKELSKYAEVEGVMLIALFIIFFDTDKDIICKFCKCYQISKDKEIALLDNTKKVFQIENSLNKKTLTSYDIFKVFSSLLTEQIAFINLYSKDKSLIKKYINYYVKELASVQIQSTGNDLMMLGIKPGPIYKEIFHELLRNKINFRWQSKKEELEYLKIDIEKWR